MQNIEEVFRELVESSEGRQFLAAKRLNLFRELHEMVFFGKGGYDFATVYSLPIWLRHYIFSEMNKFYKKEAEEMEKARSGKGTVAPKVPQVPANLRKPSVTVRPRK